MALNINREDANDYRLNKQPFELKNINELQIMTEQEKEMFAEKLRIEIHEYKNRESTYALKRKELMEIENAFRVLNQRQVQSKGKTDERLQNKDWVLSGLEDQITDFNHKKRAQDIAKNDIRDKIRQIKDVAATRKAEIDELKRVILNKERQG